MPGEPRPETSHLGENPLYDEIFDEVEMHYHPEYYQPGGLRYTPGLDDPIDSPGGQAWA
ncbi:MAG: hypothetical protein HY319_01065 [Armatimonadetes bacterium]|nr:hypothetical protein [Armatimonadota bacterium]